VCLYPHFIVPWVKILFSLMRTAGLNMSALTEDMTLLFSSVLYCAQQIVFQFCNSGKTLWPQQARSNWCHWLYGKHTFLNTATIHACPSWHEWAWTTVCVESWDWASLMQCVVCLRAERLQHTLLVIEFLTTKNTTGHGTTAQHWASLNYYVNIYPKAERQLHTYDIIEC